MTTHPHTVATVALKDHMWMVRFLKNSVITLADMEAIHQHTCNQSLLQPIVMDLREIDGIDYDALEYVAHTVCLDRFHPVALVIEHGSISEKYARLIEQLSDPLHLFQVFSGTAEAEKWLEQFVSPSFSYVQLQAD